MGNVRSCDRQTCRKVKLQTIPSYFVEREDTNDPQDSYTQFAITNFIKFKENDDIKQSQLNMDQTKNYAHPPSTAPPGTSHSTTNNSTPQAKKKNFLGNVDKVSDSANTSVVNSPKTKKIEVNCEIDNCNLHKTPKPLILSDNNDVVIEYKHILDEIVIEKEEKEKAKLMKIEQQIKSFLASKKKLYETFEQEIEQINAKYDNDIKQIKDDLKENIKSIHNS